MLNINSMTVGEALSSLRDILFVIGMAIFGFKVRSWIQPAISFFERANDFMESMQKDMQTLLTNHLSHIEHDLKHMSGRRTTHIVALEDTTDPEPPNSAEV